MRTAAQVPRQARVLRQEMSQLSSVDSDITEGLTALLGRGFGKPVDQGAPMSSPGTGYVGRHVLQEQELADPPAARVMDTQLAASISD